MKNYSPHIHQNSESKFTSSHNNSNTNKSNNHNDNNNVSKKHFINNNNNENNHVDYSNCSLTKPQIFPTQNCNNSGYNIEHSLYGSNFNCSGIKLTSNKDYSNVNSQIDDFTNNSNNPKSKILKTNTKSNNKSEDNENDDFTFNTDNVLNHPEKQDYLEENLNNKIKSLKSSYEALKASEHNNTPNINLSSSPFSNYSKKIDNYEKLNNQKSNKSQKSHRDFSFDKPSKNYSHINNDQTSSNSNLEAIESSKVNSDRNNNIILTSKSNNNTAVAIDNKKTSNNNEKFSQKQADEGLKEKQIISKNNENQNIINPNNLYEFKGNVRSDRTPHTKLGVKINLNQKTNNSVQNRNKVESSSYSEYNRNTNKVVKNFINQTNDSRANTNSSNVLGNSLSNAKLENKKVIGNDQSNMISNSYRIINNSMGNLNTNPNSIIENSTHMEVFNRDFTQKSPCLNVKTNKANFPSQIEIIKNNNNQINKAENPQSLYKNSSTASITGSIQNTFNKSYINNSSKLHQASNSNFPNNNTNHNINTNTTSLSSTIGNSNINQINNKNIISLKGNLIQNSCNNNRSTSINSIGNNTLQKNQNQESLVKTLIENGDSNKFKQTTMNSNSTTNHDENKILSTSGVESIEELHYKVVTILQSYNKIIRIQEVASEKENIFQTVNKCNEKEIE